MDFRLKYKKYSKCRHFNVKNFHMVEFNQRAAFLKNFEKSVIMRVVFHKTFCKSRFKVGKIKFSKKTKLFSKAQKL